MSSLYMSLLWCRYVGDLRPLSIKCAAEKDRPKIVSLPSGELQESLKEDEKKKKNDFFFAEIL